MSVVCNVETRTGLEGPPPCRKVVGIAASAGGLRALTVVLSALPGDLPAAVLVLQHLDPHHRSYLAEILSRRTPLQVTEARDQEAIVAGRVYVAPPDQHIALTVDGIINLTQSPRVRFVRPSADVMFESLALSYGNRAIAIMLSGTGSDGACGMLAMKRRGGETIAQDHDSSEFFGMPGAAIRMGGVTQVLPLQSIAGALVQLTHGD